MDFQEEEGKNPSTQHTQVIDSNENDENEEQVLVIPWVWEVNQSLIEKIIEAIGRYCEQNPQRKFNSLLLQCHRFFNSTDRNTLTTQLRQHSFCVANYPDDPDDCLRVHWGL